MTINIHHEQNETVYYIDINGVDYIMTRSYGLDNDGKPMQGIWGVYNELTGELIDCHQERRVLRKRLILKDVVEQAGWELIDVKLQTVEPGDLEGFPTKD